MIDRYAVQWRQATYRLNRGTWSCWPQARLIAVPDETPPLHLVTNEMQFLAFSIQHGCVVDSALSEHDQCVACSVDLESRGYTVWTAAQALAYVGSAPETETASHLVACLTQWFFLEKLPT